MSFTIKTRTWIIVAICLIVGLFVAGYIIGHRKAVLASNATISALSKEITRTTIELNNTKLYVTSVEQEIETLRQAKTDGDLTAKELRKLNLKLVNENTRLQLVVDTLFEDVFFGGQIIEVHDTVNVTGNAIKLPFDFEKKDKFLDLKGNFNDNGKLSIGLKMDASLDIWTGISSETKLPVARVTTNNPYLGVLSINSIKLDTQKPKKYSIGVMVGYGLIVKKEPQLAPFIGIGVTRSVIRF
jgi:hypothetical protein